MEQKKDFLFSLLLVSMSLPSSAGIIGESGSSIVAVETPVSVLEGQRITIHGVVTDEKGEPIVGAGVRLAGTTKGMVTDINGQFSFADIPVGSKVEVSYIGYTSQQLIVSQDNTNYTVSLQEHRSALNELVVVGYGVEKKVDLSGAVDQIGAVELERKPITDLSKGLQGMIPNLNIDFSSGEPGKSATINVRGETSINGGSPLILIDGVASDAAELNRLLPGDIATISVLKDAASAAIYGARAAFGVILITTKSGKSGKIQVNYNNTFSWSKPTSLTDKTSDPYIFLKLRNIGSLNTPWSSGHVAGDERLAWARERSDNPGGTDAIRLSTKDQTLWDYMGNTNWTNYFLDKNSFSQNHQISISGGSENTRFYLSGGYDDQNGIFSRIVNRDDYKRYSMRAKVSYDLWNWLTISNNTSYVVTDRVKPSYYNIQAIYDAEPDDMDRNPDGTWANTTLGNALAQMADGGQENTKYGRLQSTFSGMMSFWNKMLIINTNFTFEKGHQEYNMFEVPYKVGYGPKDIRETGDSRAYKGNTDDYYSVFEIYGTFHNTFDKKHDVTTVVGFNQEYNRTDDFEANRYNVLSPELPSIGLASGDMNISENYKDWAIRGLFFRANYSYANRYIFEVNGRYDGTSRFPHNKRFGFFPSGSVAWRVDSEPFFSGLSNLFSQFKLRASYGSLGNQLVSEYGYIPFMSSQAGRYIIDGKLQQTVSSAGLVSPNYSWEQVYTLNGGIDLGFFNNRLTLSFDIYRRDTKGMLTLGKELPGVLGTTEPMENAANLKTRGWELSIGYQDHFNVGGKPMEIGARFVLSDSRAWITKFDNPTRNLGQYYKGQEIGEIWGLQSDGFFRSKEEIAKLDETQIIPWGALSIVEGWPKYKDLDGDKQITKGTTVDKPGDLSVIGNSSPRFRMGLNLNASWNGFDVSVFMQGVLKRDYYPLSYLYWGFFQQPYSGGQLHTFDFYRATDDTPEEMKQHSQAYINAGLANKNLDAKYPVLQCWLADKNLGTGLNAMGLAIPQTGYMLNGAYVRVKNITIGYTLPEKWVKKMNLNRVRFYVSGDNLLTFSQLKKYFDPEAVTDTSTFGYVYPFNRQYSCGVNITF